MANLRSLNDLKTAEAARLDFAALEDEMSRLEKITQVALETSHHLNRLAYVSGCCTLTSLELTPRVTHTMEYPDAALWAIWDFAAAKAEICGFAMATGGALVQDSYITSSQFDGQAPTHSLAFRERGGVTPKKGRSLSAITRAYHTQAQHRVS